MRIKEYIKDRVRFLKENLDKRSLIAVSIFLILLIIIMVLPSKEEKRVTEINNIPISTSTVYYDSGETKVFSYTGGIYFGDDIEKICPFYFPDGVSYRRCLDDFVDQQTMVLNEQYRKLLNDLRDTRDKEDGSWLDYVILDISDYKSAWDSFIYKKCALNSIDTILGTAHSEQISLCILGEIEDLSIKLNEIDKNYNHRNWSDGSIVD